jgi:hypothetical protein
MQCIDRVDGCRGVAAEGQNASDDQMSSCEIGCQGDAASRRGKRPVVLAIPRGSWSCAASAILGGSNDIHKNARLTPRVAEAAGVSFRFRWPIAARMIVQRRWPTTNESAATTAEAQWQRGNRLRFAKH